VAVPQLEAAAEDALMPLGNEIGAVVQPTMASGDRRKALVLDVLRALGVGA
jgi:hypothetical protein